MSKELIRAVSDKDIPAILDIYAYYVENTTITFETSVPSLTEFSLRVNKIKNKYPYLVMIKDDKVVGYCYANTFKNRAAYDHSVEVSIYLHHDYLGQGLGSKLYDILEVLLKKQHITNLYACITCTLDKQSINYHQKQSYQMIGKFNKCGYKFNQYLDVVWMEKILTKQTSHQDVIFFKDLKR